MTHQPVFSSQVICCTEVIQVYTDKDSHLEPLGYEGPSLSAIKRGKNRGKKLRLKWAHQDSNLEPTGYAPHHGFRRPFRVCEPDCPFTLLSLRVPAVQSLHLPITCDITTTGLARDYLTNF